MSSPHPTVSIVIPAYNEQETIEACLLAAVTQTQSADEIIVVNNKSTDDTAAVVRRFQREHPAASIRLLAQNKEQGITPTRNHGFDAATSEIIGRIDADSRIDSKWVAAVRRAFRVQKVMAITGPVIYHDMPWKEFGHKADNRLRQFISRRASKYQLLFGSNMAIRRSAWREVRRSVCPDHENVMHEDIDIGLHLAERGLLIRYTPTMVSGMSARRIEDSPRQFYDYTMRMERTFKRHNVTSRHARIPALIYLLIYFPARTVRKLYDHETGKFSLRKLRTATIEEGVAHD